MVQDQKLGYVHTQQERQGDRIQTRSKLQFTARRAGTSLDITMNTTSTEMLNGEPLAFSSEQIFSAVPVRQSGTIEQGVITLTAEQFGQKMQQKIPYPQGALLEWGMYLETLKHKLEPGTTIKLLAFVPAQALNIGIPTTVEILGREEIEVLGKKMSAFKTKSTTEISGTKIEALGWADDELSPIKQELTLLGQTFTMVRCDKPYALKDLTGAELFANTLIPIGRRIERDQAQAVTYKISAVGDAELPELPQTEMQRVVQRQDCELTLYVQHADRNKPPAATPAVDPGEEFLLPSVFITSADPLVVELARSTVAGEKAPLKMAELLCRKVSAEIKYKDLGTAFATAAEICRNKSGDCTEHGALLAALGRAVGIPSRVVTGLIYVEHMAGQDNVLGFHMWTQFWIDGRWLDFDAAWDQIDPDPTHIALGAHSLRDGAIGSLVSGAMLQSSSLRISVADLHYKP